MNFNSSFIPELIREYAWITAWNTCRQDVSDTAICASDAKDCLEAFDRAFPQHKPEEEDADTAETP